MQTASSHSLNESQWQKVQRYEPLPIFAHTKESFRLALAKPEVSFDTLANIANNDPALCWHLQNHISQKSQGKKEALNSARQCLSLLGMQATVDLVKHLPVVSPTDEKSQVYLEQLHIALFSARLAKKLAYTTEPNKAQSMHWHTLLSRAPLWRLSWQYPQATQALQKLLESNVALVQANERIFGKDSEPKWLKLAESMKLPNNVVALYDPSLWPKISVWKTLLRQDPRLADKENRIMMHTLRDPNLILHSTNCLTMAQQSAPQYTNAARWNAINGHVFGKPPQQIQSQVRQVQLSLAHEGVGLSALGLHKLAAPTQPPPLKQLMTEKHPSKESKPKSIDYLYGLMNQFQQPKAHFKNWLALMQAILDGIENGVGLEVGGVLLKEQNNAHIKMLYKLDGDANNGINNLKINHQQAGLFNKLMDKSGFIHISPSNHGAYLKPYPDRVISAVPKQACLMSIHSGSKPLGIVLGATASEHESISKQQQQAFKALCLKASNGLEALKQKRPPN